jgi:hypothetical protein
VPTDIVTRKSRRSQRRRKHSATRSYSDTIARPDAAEIQEISGSREGTSAARRPVYLFPPGDPAEERRRLLAGACPGCGAAAASPGREGEYIRHCGRSGRLIGVLLCLSCVIAAEQSDARFQEICENIEQVFNPGAREGHP